MYTCYNVLIAFELLHYLEIALTFECTAWLYGLVPLLPTDDDDDDVVLDKLSNSAEL